MPAYAVFPLTGDEAMQLSGLALLTGKMLPLTQVHLRLLGGRDMLSLLFSSPLFIMLSYRKLKQQKSINTN